MLFSEVYGSYFNVVAAVLTEAITGNLTEKRLNEIIRNKAFSESVLHILPTIKSEAWKLVDNKLGTPIKHVPTMPLTTLQKQWLKSLLLDPRIALFDLSGEGLEDVEPLYKPEDFCYFDRYTDGDPYKDASYIANFRTILRALNEKRKLDIRFFGRKGGSFNSKCIPYCLEYSAKDDKFRLLTTGSKRFQTINLARIEKCELLEAYNEDEFYIPDSSKQTLIIELEDERNALERAMLQFSYLEKETERLDDKRYRITLRYARDDETEILISVTLYIVVHSGSRHIGNEVAKYYQEEGLRALCSNARFQLDDLIRQLRESGQTKEIHKLFVIFICIYPAAEISINQVPD